MLSSAERTAALQSFKKSRKQMSVKNMDPEAPAASPKEAPADADSFRNSNRSIDPNVDRAMVLPFDQVVMTFEDVHYWVNCPPVNPWH